MGKVISAIMALLGGGIIIFFAMLHRQRRRLRRLPHPPSSWLWGHLKIAAECNKLMPPNSHAQTWLEYVRDKYDLGDVFFLDWWPFGPQIAFIADPELASKYITTAQSLPKAPVSARYVDRLLGEYNMVSLDGPRWKFLRSVFNPGFSASHLVSLVPYMIDSSLVFVNILRKHAETNELIELDRLAGRYAIDIIGKIAMDTDLNSQIRPHPIVDTFRRQIDLQPIQRIGPLDDLNVLRPFQLWWNTRKLNQLIGAEFDKRILAREAELRAKGSTEKTGSLQNRRRSILDLAIDAYEKEDYAPDTNKSTISASFRTTAIDSLKTFIFAGHDTSSSTIAYVMYLLHLHPDVQKRVARELDTVYGADSSPEQIAETIRAQPHSINRLEYLQAVLKETLRLFPPASTLRMTASDTVLQDAVMPDPKTGQPIPLAGVIWWPAAHLIHRNEAYFPNAIKFVPERFLPAETPYPDAKLFTPAGKDAWRPFEKGPRNCIGQELAIMEIKAVLACVVKELDFTPEYDGEKIDHWTPIRVKDEVADGVPGAKRLTLEGHRAYQILQGAACPRNAMPGRLKLRR